MTDYNILFNPRPLSSSTPETHCTRGNQDIVNLETVTLKCLTITMMDLNRDLSVLDVTGKDILSLIVHTTSTLQMVWLQKYNICRVTGALRFRKKQNWCSIRCINSLQNQRVMSQSTRSLGHSAQKKEKILIQINLKKSRIVQGILLILHVFPYKQRNFITQRTRVSIL